MASLALQVLQIVPAAGKADVPSASSPRDDDSDFLNHLASAMERRDDALDTAALRAAERDAANTKDAEHANEDAPRGGEAISDAAPNHDNRKDAVVSNAVDNSDRGPVANRDDVTTDSADAKRHPAQGVGERQPSESADTSTNTDTGEPASPTTAAADNGEHLGKTAPKDSVLTASSGETVVAAADLPLEADGAPATPNAAAAPAAQPIAIPGNPGQIIEGAALAHVSVAPDAAPVTVPAGKKAGDHAASTPAAQTDLPIKPAAQPDLAPLVQPDPAANPTVQPLGRADPGSGARLGGVRRAGGHGKE